MLCEFFRSSLHLWHLSSRFDVTHSTFPCYSARTLLFVYSIVVSCGDPGTPVNGRRLISGYTEGHAVNYTCNVGYELSGVTTRTCLPNGAWSANLPTCLGECFTVCTQKNELFNACQHDFCYTVETLYRGHFWDTAGCPLWRGIRNSEIDLYTGLCGWDCRQCPH